jgi:hypothetical protein
LDIKSYWFKYSKRALAGCGTQTAALAFGGRTGVPTNVGATEEYNGSTWTSNPTGLNTARGNLGGAGIQTAALAFGGSPPNTGATEEYDGSTWTSSPASLATARGYLAGAGTQSSALAFGGYTTTCFSSNRRMDRSRSRSNKNNYSKLTGGKYGTYKNIHRS